MGRKPTDRQIREKERKTKDGTNWNIRIFKKTPTDLLTFCLIILDSIELRVFALNMLHSMFVCSVNVCCIQSWQILEHISAS